MDQVTDPYRILITGWRDWPESHRGIIWRALDGIAWDATGKVPSRPIVVVHGKCPYGGVDLYAEQWADRQDGASPEQHPAERGPRGQILGPARNTLMVNLGADVCLAFPGPKSRGTWDCVRKAVDADIPTRVVAWCTAWGKDYAEDND